MSIASLHRKTKHGERARGYCAPRAVFPSPVNETLPPPTVGSLSIYCFNHVNALASNLAYARFEGSLWKVKWGFPILVSVSCNGPARPSVPRHGASGCAARQHSAA